MHIENFKTRDWIRIVPNTKPQKHLEILNEEDLANVMIQSQTIEPVYHTYWYYPLQIQAIQAPVVYVKGFQNTQIIPIDTRFAELHKLDKNVLRAYRRTQQKLQSSNSKQKKTFFG